MTKHGGKFDLEQYACPAGGSHKIQTFIDEDEYPYGMCTRCKAPSRFLDQQLREAGVKARAYVKPKQSSRVPPPRKTRARQGPRIR